MLRAWAVPRSCLRWLATFRSCASCCELRRRRCCAVAACQNARTLLPCCCGPRHLLARKRNSAGKSRFCGCRSDASSCLAASSHCVQRGGTGAPGGHSRCKRCARFRTGGRGSASSSGAATGGAAAAPAPAPAAGAATAGSGNGCGRSAGVRLHKAARAGCGRGWRQQRLHNNDGPCRSCSGGCGTSGSAGSSACCCGYCRKAVDEEVRPAGVCFFLAACLQKPG